MDTEGQVPKKRHNYYIKNTQLTHLHNNSYIITHLGLTEQVKEVNLCKGKVR